MDNKEILERLRKIENEAQELIKAISENSGINDNSAEPFNYSSAEPVKEITPAKIEYNEEDFIIDRGILLAYLGNDKIVRVPEGVVEIGSTVFLSKQNIKVIILPDSVKKLFS